MTYFDGRVVARDDGSFEVLGVDAKGMKESGLVVPLAVLGCEMRPQVLRLMLARGEDVGGTLVDQRCAEMVGVGRSAFSRMRAIERRDPALLPKLATGEMTVADANRQLGLSGGRTLIGTESLQQGQRLSRTDAFPDATEPLVRYLDAWEKRGFEFRHLNPKEAAKRLKTIDRLIDGLTKAREDLALRSHRATMKVEG